jgi:dTDP-4-amino-4,6-dideoxygalactose transaminase
MQAIPPVKLINDMHVPFVDLVAQYQSIKTEIDEAIRKVILDSAFIGGPSVKLFEKEWAKTIGSKHCVATGNGTDSIEILLQVFGVGAGDEVIVPSHSWISTAEAVVTAGARPVFVDTIDRLYTIDPGKIEETITERTRAIIPVHLCGLPADMDPILRIAAKYKLRVIEDCAQAHLAEYKGRRIGTLGHAASFSFYPGKNLGAYGDAGAIVTNDDEVAEVCRRIANHGQLQKHTHLIPGRNSRLDGLQAAILLAKLPYLEEWTRMRIEKARAYHSLLDQRFNLTVVPADNKHVYHLFVVQVRDRDQVTRMLKEQGIDTAVHYPVPMPFMPAFKKYLSEGDSYNIHRSYVDKILSIPIFPELTVHQMEFVASALSKVYVEK